MDKVERFVDKADVPFFRMDSIYLNQFDTDHSPERGEDLKLQKEHENLIVSFTICESQHDLLF